MILLKKILQQLNLVKVESTFETPGFLERNSAETQNMGSFFRFKSLDMELQHDRLTRLK